MRWRSVSSTYRYYDWILDALAGRIPKAEYAAHVVALRRRYLILSVPTTQWLMKDTPDSNEGR